MTGIVAHTYPEWWFKLTGQVAHWSTDYSRKHEKTYYFKKTNNFSIIQLQRITIFLLNSGILIRFAIVVRTNSTNKPDTKIAKANKNTYMTPRVSG